MVQPCLDGPVIDLIGDLSPRDFVVPVFLASQQELLMAELRLIGYVAMEKQTLTKPQVRAMPLQVGRAMSQLVERRNEFTVVVVIAEDEMELAVRVDGGEVIEPMDCRRNRMPEARERTPAEIEDVAAKNERRRPLRSTPNRLRVLRRQGAPGKEVQVGHKKLGRHRSQFYRKQF
jgi:hypothetical protein